jgi:hypothetical protein
MCNESGKELRQLKGAKPMKFANRRVSAGWIGVRLAANGVKDS